MHYKKRVISTKYQYTLRFGETNMAINSPRLMKTRCMVYSICKKEWGICYLLFDTC